MSLTPAEILMHNTVRLECTLNDDSKSTGTGFFFSFKNDDGSTKPLIVTNKHVIENSRVGTFVLTKSDDKDQPILGDTEDIKIGDFEHNFEQSWVKHPDNNVDLAVLPLAPLYRIADERGIKFFAPPIIEDFLPTPERIADLSGLENITMIGYPNGLWDEVNNLPIIRRGITATNPKHDYNGDPVIVIDCACFPGSSGSPVFIYDVGGYLDSSGTYNIGGNRIFLLGVLFAGPQHVARGEIQVIDAPLAQVPISLSKIPNNLGLVVKAHKIADFRETLSKSR